MNPDSRVLGVCKTASRLVADVKWFVTSGISGVLGAEPPNSPFFFHINKILGTTYLYLYPVCNRLQFYAFWSPNTCISFYEQEVISSLWVLRKYSPMMQNAFISRPKGPAYAMGYSYREIPWTIVFLARVKKHES